MKTFTMNLVFIQTCNLVCFLFFSFSFFFLRFFIYFRETVCAGARGKAEGEGEAVSPLSREPNTMWGLDPRTLKS